MSKAASPQTRRRVPILPLLLLGLPILLLLLFFVRHRLIAAYATIFYKPGVGRHFNETFTPVNTQLQDLGFTPNSQTPDRNTWHSDTCEVSSYGGSVACIKAQGNIKQNLTKEFVDTWEQRSPEFDAYLLKNGWQHAGGTVKAIEELYKNPDSQVGAILHYTKNQGSLHCSIAIDYLARTSYTSITEQCWRTLNFPDIHERNVVLNWPRNIHRAYQMSSVAPSVDGS